MTAGARGDPGSDHSGSAGSLQASAQIRFYILTAFLVLCLLIGGSAQKFVLADTLLMLASLPLVWIALQRIGALPRLIQLFALALFVCFVFQLMPGLDFLSGDEASPAFALTRDVGRTLESAALCLLAFSAFVVTGDANPAAHQRLAGAVLVIAGLSAVLGVIQTSASEGAVLTDWFDYEMRFGFFRNRNHLAALLAASLPLMGLVAGVPVVALWFAFVLLVQLAVGSDAGFVLTLLAGTLSLGLLSGRRFALPVLLCALCGFGAFLWLRGAAVHTEITGNISRLTLAQDTTEAIAFFWPLGSGFGTFETVYPRFEKPERVIEFAVNHAHNDGLELLVEGGLPTLLLMLAYFALLVSRMGAALRSPVRTAALLAIAVMLIHSAVDFPLRTTALLVVFAVLNGMYFQPFASAAPGKLEAPA